MIETLAAVGKEVANEVTVSEVSKTPTFFEDISESKGNTDTPVAKESGEKIYLITRNESLAGDVHPITGVPFEKRIIELPTEEIIEGVFPEFESIFDAQIPENLFNETDYRQFKECNTQLNEAIENSDELKSKFTEEQLEQIRDGMSDGTAPDGYVWHHNEECGKIQLVEYDLHAHTGHTGGRSVWGGGNENR